MWQSEIRLYMSGENLSEEKVLRIVDFIEESFNNRMDRVYRACSRDANRILMESGINGVSLEMELL